jgi:hypothetical protein
MQAPPSSLRFLLMGNAQPVRATSMYRYRVTYLYIERAT